MNALNKTAAIGLYGCTNK